MAKFTVKAFAIVEVEIEADTPEQAWEKYDEVDIFSDYAENRNTRERVKMDWSMSECMTLDMYHENGMWVDEREQ